MSSRSIRSSSSISASASTISVRRGVANSSLTLRQLGPDDGQDARARAQDVQIIGDLGGELVDFGLDLVAAECGQALQAQLEDGFRLLVGQPSGALRRHLVARIGDQFDQRPPSLAGQSRAIKPSRASLASCEPRISAITSSILATAMARPTRIWPRSRALPSWKLGAPRHDLFAEGDEGGDHVLQGHQLRTAAVERQHVDAEGRLQRREAVELVQHHVGRGVALELDHHAHAVAVALVAQIGDAFDALLAHQFGDALDHAPPCSPGRGSR